MHRPARIRTRIILLFASLVFSAVSGLFADDWPQWRGKNREGVWHEDGILDRFPAGGPEVKWRVPLGSGYSGPSVADGRIFVMDWTKTEGTRAMEGTERLHCFDEETGKTLWTQAWPAAYGSLMVTYATGPRATPTVDGDLVYALGAVGDLVAAKAEDGEVVWRRDFVEEYGASVPIWGTTGSPLVDGDLLITVAGAENDGKVIAYDKRTGEERWRAISSDWEMGYEQPVIIKAGGARQLIIWEPKAVFSLNPVNGEVYWSQEWDVRGGLSVATVVTDGRQLLFSQFYKGSLMMELDAHAPKAKLVWMGEGKSEMPDQTRGLHSLITTPILEGDAIYGVCSYGELRGLDARTGERLWQTDQMTRQGRWGAAFMVKNGDRWFVNNDQGELIIADFSREGYHEIDRVKLLVPNSDAAIARRREDAADVNWSHPAYANGHIVARNDSELIRVSLEAE